ncbi:MAG: phosphatase PAP2 family protein [Gaiella sp.]
MTVDELALRPGARPTDAVASERAEPPPVLRPAPGGLAERFAERVGPRHPVRVFAAAIVAGYLLIVGAMISIGLIFTTFVLSLGGIEESDVDAVRWLVDRRDATVEDASWVGSTVSGGHVIPVVVGTLLVIFLLRRRWLLAATTLFLIAVESGTYRATTLVVERERPPVERLENLPTDASFPSGHTAASLALYGGLLLLAVSSLQRRWFTVVAIVATALVVSFVAWSRTTRGMYHPTDTLAGVLVGLLAIAVTVFAARAATAAARAREAGR